MPEDPRLAGRRLLSEAECMADLPDGTVLLCPLCPHEIGVSPEDPDASLDDMHGHWRCEHHQAAKQIPALVRALKVAAPRTRSKAQP